MSCISPGPVANRRRIAPSEAQIYRFGSVAPHTARGILNQALYDAAGRLTAACHAASCTGTGFDLLDFTYDGEGHRTRIVETAAAGPVTTRDLRYQGDAVVEESVNGTIVRSTVVDDAGAPTKLVVTNSGSANGTYLPTWNGHGDLLALWQVQADGTLILAASVTCDTWGRPVVTSANGIPDLGWSRLYVGRSDVWWDNAFGAGLLYMHARSYSLSLGRFLQPDPVAAEGNLYAYAGNSPVTKVDPQGRYSLDCLLRLLKIVALRNELVKRFVEIVDNKLGLPTYGRFSVIGHQQMFRNQQRNLQRQLREYQMNCENSGGGPSPPSDCWRWATTTAPSPARARTSLKLTPMAVLGGVFAAIGGIWWSAKVLAPAFGPFAPVWLIAG